MFGAQPCTGTPATEATESREGSIIPGSGADDYKKNGTWSKAEHYAHDMIGDFNNWVTGFIDWNLALDMDGGPLHINVVKLEALGSHAAVHMDAKKGEVYYQTIFDYIGHFSKFVPEGAKRIDWQLVSPSIPEHCSVELTEQKSDKECVKGVNFDCIEGTGKMWASDGCRGTFTCDGVPGIKQASMGHANRTLDCLATPPPLEVTAFSADGTIIAVVLNQNDVAVDFELANQGEFAALTVPPHSIQTLTFPASSTALV